MTDDDQALHDFNVIFCPSSMIKFNVTVSVTVEYKYCFLLLF